MEPDINIQIIFILLLSADTVLTVPLGGHGGHALGMPSVGDGTDLILETEGDNHHLRTSRFYRCCRSIQ